MLKNDSVNENNCKTQFFSSVIPNYM